MLVELIERLLWVLFWVSTLNMLRHGYFFIHSWAKSESDNPERYIVQPNTLFLLGISIGYFITVIIRGINL